MADFDIGKRDTYCYHVLNGNKRDVSPKIIDAWYPEFVGFDELLFLHKIYGLSDKRDGRLVQLTDADLPYLFMTAECDKVLRGSDVVFTESRDRYDRARARYFNFTNCGLLCGDDIYHLGLTFTGRSILETRVSWKVKDFVFARLNDTVSRYASEFGCAFKSSGEKSDWNNFVTSSRLRYAYQDSRFRTCSPESIFDKIKCVDDVLDELYSVFNKITELFSSEFLLDFCFEKMDMSDIYTVLYDICY